MVQTYNPSMISPYNTRLSADTHPQNVPEDRPTFPQTLSIKPAIVRNLLAALVAVAIFSLGLVTVRHFTQPASGAGMANIATLTIPVTVAPGDTLWSLSQRYGNSDINIQDRVDTIAKANDMTAGTPLISGQRLLVPVTNTVELARLQTHLASR